MVAKSVYFKLFTINFMMINTTNLKQKIMLNVMNM